MKILSILAKHSRKTFPAVRYFTQKLEFVSDILIRIEALRNENSPTENVHSTKVLISPY